MDTDFVATAHIQYTLRNLNVAIGTPYLKAELERVGVPYKTLRQGDEVKRIYRTVDAQEFIDDLVRRTQPGRRQSVEPPQQINLLPPEDTSQDLRARLDAQEKLLKETNSLLAAMRELIGK